MLQKGDNGKVTSQKEEQSKPQEIEKKEVQKQENKEQEEKINKTGYINDKSVYMRSGPSTDNEILKNLVLNDEVTITGEDGEWYKVTFEKQDGYVAKRLVSDKKTETTSRSDVDRKIEEVNDVQKQEVEKDVSTKDESTIGAKIVEEAKKYLNVPYVYGGSSKNGFDCSGFTMYIYSKFGKSLSHSARAQSNVGTYVSKSNLRPGDLVFFKDYPSMNGIGHCGIYIGDGNFIHASSGTGYCVKISTLLSGSYYNRYETARRLF